MIQPPYHLSWSSLNYWHSAGRAKWYDHYVHGKRGKPSRLMLLGSRVADSMITDNPLVPFRRLTIIEKRFECDLPVVGGDPVPLYGFADTMCDEGFMEHNHTAIIGEFKTGMLADSWGHPAWHEAKVLSSGQLKFYVLCTMIQHGIIAENVECYLQWKPVVMSSDWEFVLSDLPIQTWTVRFTTEEIGRFSRSLVRAWSAMVKYVAERQEDEELSTPTPL